MDVKNGHGREKKSHVHAHVLEKIAVSRIKPTFFCQVDVRT